MKTYLIFILINILIFIILLFAENIEKFNLNKYRLIIIKNNNYIIMYIKDPDNYINNKFYKIYKNKFI